MVGRTTSRGLEVGKYGADFGRRVAISAAHTRKGCPRSKWTPPWSLGTVETAPAADTDRSATCILTFFFSKRHNRVHKCKPSSMDKSPGEGLAVRRPGRRRSSTSMCTAGTGTGLIGGARDPPACAGRGRRYRVAPAKKRSDEAAILSSRASCCFRPPPFIHNHQSSFKNDSKAQTLATQSTTCQLQAPHLAFNARAYQASRAPNRG